MSGAVLRPETEAEVAEAVAEARRAGRRVRVRGGGSSAVPAAAGEVLVDTSGLRGIVELRPSDGVVTVYAGTPLADVASALREVGRRMPLEPWAPPGATIGGAVAAAADGLVARNGVRWRDVVLGVRAVLGTGEVVTTGASVVKSVAGYDVPRMLVGSRGTFAVITCLHVRIEPVPRATAGFQIRCGSASDVASSVALLDALPWEPTSLVATPGRHAGASVLHVRYDDGTAAVRAVSRRLEGAGSRPVEDAATVWGQLAASASAPPPAPRHRRVAPGGRGVPTAAGPARAGDWVADLGRGRVTWTDAAPAPARDPATAALFERVRRAFDPDGVFAAGRGYGAP